MKELYSLLLIFSLLIFNSEAQDPQEFFLDDWQPKFANSPQYVNTPQPADAATVVVTVDLNDKITKVSKYIYGNNAVPWAGKMNNDANLVKHIKNLSPNVLRWPGGNLSNEHFWDAVEGKGPTDIPPTLKINALNAGMNTTNWAMTVDNYYDLLKKTNSTGCICVNYSYARYGTSIDPVAKAAHYAANWVRYDKGRTKYWEIGNENMGPWQAGYEIDVSLNKDGQPKTISGDLYGRHSRVFIDSMKRAAAEIGSEIKVGVCMVEESITYNAVMNKWNSGAMPHIADKADFLVIHSYYTPYNENSTIATILNSAGHTKNTKAYVLNDLKTYGKKDNLPVVLTEWNIFAVGSKQQVSYINGMHATLVLGELIKNKYGQAMRWDLANGWSNGDDHGMFARSDEPGVTAGTPHAPYYYMYYFQKYFGDHMVGSSVTGNTNIVSYASSFTNGGSGIVVVNKGTAKQVVELKLNNFPEAKSYYRYVLTGGTDNGNFSRKVFVNGEGATQEGGGPLNYETLKAFGRTISGPVKFDVPPLSVTYILVTSDVIPPITGAKKIESGEIKIYPNPAKNYFELISPGFAYNKLVITNMAGQEVYKQIFNEPIIGSYKYNLNLNSGIYILGLHNGINNISKKLIIK